jgi:chromosome segregation ATPase
MTGVGLLGVFVGMGIGYVAVQSLAEPQEVITQTQVVQEELSNEDLEELCKGLTDAEKRNVLEVQEEVKSLQSTLADREAELEKLKAEKHTTDQARKAARAKWKAMEEEIATLQIQLAAAEQERDELKVELQNTLVELKKQVKKTQHFKAKAKKYKAESTANLWTAFQAQAKVKGCDRGSKKRHEKCHEAFDLSMTEKVKQRFYNCVDTYQAVPVLRKVDNETELPPHSAFLSSDTRFTKDWAIIFCDPTLPEARDRDLDDEPSTTQPTFTPDEEKSLDFDLKLDD